MRLVIWQDDDGYKHRSWIKDTDSDDKAPQGLPSDPPDLGRLDWEGIKRAIHNSLTDQGLVTWEDVQQKQNAIAGIVLAEVRKPIVALYRSEKENG